MGNSDRIWTESVKALGEFDNCGIPPGSDFGQNRVHTALGLALLGMGCALDEALKFCFGLLRISHDAE